MIKRFKFVDISCNPATCFMNEDGFGDYVMYDDYVAEVAQLRNENRVLSEARNCECATDDMRHFAKERAELRKKVKQLSRQVDIACKALDELQRLRNIAHDSNFVSVFNIIARDALNTVARAGRE